MTADPRDAAPTAPSEFAERRARVLGQLEGAALVLASGAPVAYSRDIEHRFRPDGDFWYLTGCMEPHAVLVLRPDAESPFTLFVRPRQPAEESWSGRRPGPEGAIARFGADAAFPIAELGDKLADLLDGCERLFFAPWKHSALDATVRRTLTHLARKEVTGRRAPEALVDPGVLLHEMRLVKSAAELALTRAAAGLTARGHRAGIARVAPGVAEYEVQAAIEHAFANGGAAGPGFATIVGAGANGCVLHYTENRATIGAEDLVLIDAGAELHGYNGDITRTVPASGRFTPAQRAVYDIVLAAEEAAIAAVRPGTTFEEVNMSATRVLVQGMLDLGLLAGTVDGLVEDGRYRRFYPHRTSHWLGVDVHDVGRYRAAGASRPLAPGMVLTVEPGLYIPPDDESVPPALRGLAVRIEDDVAVAPEGCEVLTRSVPVAADEIAALVGGGRP